MSQIHRGQKLTPGQWHRVNKIDDLGQTGRPP